MISLPSGRAPIKWSLDLAAKIEGIELPFRLRVATSDEEEFFRRIDAFHCMLLRALDEHLPDETAQED